MGILLLLILFPLGLMVLYLDVLTVAAVVDRRMPPPVPSQNRFALLIPAHNEERQLPRLVESIAALAYPRHLYQVHVIADNCTDATAMTAAKGGAIVHERQNQHLLGKGYAIQWLLARLNTQRRHYDGYVIVDADSVISSNFLAVMNNHLTRGDQAVQSYDGVLNREESWISALSYVALALFNNLRPLGRDRLGLSVGLRGNGMCFSSAVIERFGWDVFGLAEDHAYHVQLVSAGVRVRYAAEASVLAEQPTSLAQAYTQSIRWERGRFQLFSRHFISQGILHRDPAVLDALAEQIVPPFSILTGATALTFFLAVLFQLATPLILASVLLLGEISYVVIGLRLVGAKRSVYVSLLKAPLYVVWKLWIVGAAAAHPRKGQWLRTARSEEEA